MASSLFDPPSKSDVQDALASIWRAAKSKAAQAIAPSAADVPGPGTLDRRHEIFDQVFHDPQAGQRARELADRIPDMMMGSTSPSGVVGRAEKAALDMSEAARMGRAKEMGFDTSKEWYHGTPNTNNVEEFLTDRVQPHSIGGTWFAERPGYSSHYAGEGGQVLPVHLKMNNPAGWKEYEEALKASKDLGNTSTYNQNKFVQDYLKKRGFDGIKFDQIGDNVAVAFDPSQIRSKFAEFDPAKASSGNLSAAISATTGAGLLGAGALGSNDASASDMLAPPTSDEIADFMNSKPSKRGN